MNWHCRCYARAMTYKHTMTMDNALTHVETAGIPFAGLFAKLKNAVTVRIPVGYQDESGFHAGVKTVGDDIQWPATW